ncbi:MAG: transposase, partial [Bacteroidales bacterium]|nr:transposase [Bacteroidales bacterium]
AHETTPRKTPEQKKWTIKYDGNKKRYFDQKQVEICQLRKQISATPQSVLNRRNNVEATIFQLGYHYTNDKSRYRGLIKHKMWANIRCLWVNFVRIVKFVTQNSLICEQKYKFSTIFVSFFLIHAKNTLCNLFFAHFCLSFSKIENICYLKN